MMNEIPTADDVAIAIVTACRETGEDPIETIQRRMGVKARHYALHALLHVFPKLSRVSAASMVGCPGKPGAFLTNSWNQVVRPYRNGANPHMAKWFDDKAYDRVIRAIEAGRSEDAADVSVAEERIAELDAHPERLVVVEAPVRVEPKPYKPGPLPSASGYRPPADTIRRILEEDDSRPVFDRGKERVVRPPQPKAGSSKQGLRDMLADAAKRTAEIKSDGDQ